MPQLSLITPLGDVTLTEEDGAIIALDWGRGRDQEGTALLKCAAAQLQDYFDGRRLGFDLPLRPHGTPFQQRVWAALTLIAPGQTLSYGELARAIGSAPRAIGQANRMNPLPVLIPCHRVVAADGSLGGYSGLDGPETKRFLLAHEARTLNKDGSLAPPGVPTR